MWNRINVSESKRWKCEMGSRERERVESERERRIWKCHVLCNEFIRLQNSNIKWIFWQRIHRLHVYSTDDDEILFVPFARREQKRARQQQRAVRECEREKDSLWHTYMLECTLHQAREHLYIVFTLKLFTHSIPHRYHFSIWKFIFKKQKQRKKFNKTTHNIYELLCAHINQIKNNNNNKKKRTIPVPQQYTLYFICHTCERVNGKEDSFEFSLLTTSLKCDWTLKHTHTHTYEHTNITLNGRLNRQKKSQSCCRCLLCTLCCAMMKIK